MTELLQKAWEICFHLDEALNHWAAAMGGWLYVLLFAIIFCETGLVILPFLPGDSLLFAVGALGSSENSVINMPLMALVLIVAAVLGDAVNYSIGAKLGPKVFRSENSKLLNKKHLLAAQDFYERYGGKTIILARFIPIIRTFAPFIAGIGTMSYPRFALYNITGAILWVISLMSAGYYFGQIEYVKKNFEAVIVAIVVISVLPAVVEFVRAKMQSDRAKKAAARTIAESVASGEPVSEESGR